jgi:uncharacterized protein
MSNKPADPFKLLAASMELPSLPFAPEQIIAGSPDASGVVLWQPDDASLSRTGVWGCEPGVFDYKQEPNEMSSFAFFSGRASITAAGHDAIEVSAGDVIHLPEGTDSRWDVTETIRTFYCVFD